MLKHYKGILKHYNNKRSEEMHKLTENSNVVIISINDEHLFSSQLNLLGN